MVTLFVILRLKWATIRQNWFHFLDQLFDVYDVPASLQAILIRPLLNEKARDYLAKLDPEISAALLSEFKLSPNLYLERFNACLQDNSPKKPTRGQSSRGLDNSRTGQLADSEFLKMMELLYVICTLNLTLTLPLTPSNIGSV